MRFIYLLFSLPRKDFFFSPLPPVLLPCKHVSPYILARKWLLSGREGLEIKQTRWPTQEVLAQNPKIAIEM